MNLSHDCGLSGCSCDDFSDLGGERVLAIGFCSTATAFSLRRSLADEISLISLVWNGLTDCLTWLSMDEVDGIVECI